jgi:hypothetical protein
VGGSRSPSHGVKIIQKRDAGEKWQGWELAADKPSYTGPHKRIAHFQVRLAGRWPDDAIEIQTKERVAVTAPHHLLIEYDGSGKASGIDLLMASRWRSEVLKDHLSGDFRTSAPLEIGDKSLGIPFEGAWTTCGFTTAS